MISKVFALVVSWLLGLLLGAPSVRAAPVHGALQVELMLLPIGSEEKIGPVDVKFGGNLFLDLTVGDLALSSLSAFTFKGVEFQAFTVTARLGPALARDTIIFAPNLVEIEQQRNLAGLPVYCVNLSDPMLPLETDLTLPLDVGLPACPVTADNDLAAASLYYLIEGHADLTTISNFIHPIFSDLTLTRIFEGAGHLDQPLSLRKKIVDLEIELGVFHVGLRALFVNVGSSASPTWQKGFLAAFEARFDEIVVRSETWVGIKPGVECFAECNLVQRFHEGVIAQEFMTIEERLSIRGLRIASVLVGAQVEFGFDSSSFHLHIIELTQQFVVASPVFTILNTLRIGRITLNSIKVLSQSIVTQLNIGDITATAVFNIWPGGTTNGIHFYWSRLITVFDPPGIKLTSDIQVCQDSDICGTLPDVLTHDLYLTTSVGDIAIQILLGFNSLMMSFRQAAIDVSWNLGNILLNSVTAVNGNALILQMFSFTFTF